MIVTNVLFVMRRLWNCGLPEAAPPQLRNGCRAMLAATVPLWSLGFVGTSVPWALVPLVRDGAVVTLILAGVWWGQSWRLREDRRREAKRDDDMRILIRQNGDLCELAMKGESPDLLRRVR